jgi:hypothetical protein
VAGPSFVSIGARAQSAGAATLTPSLPTVFGTGGLLVCVVHSKNNATHATVTSGWSKLGSTVNSGASFCASVFVAPEGSAAPVITWTGSVACGAQIAYYADPANTVDPTLGASTSNTGSTATHSTSAINTTRNNSDVIYVDAAAANTAMATPSGWTENSDAGSATDAGRFVFGQKAVATSGSSSGAISVTGASAAWVQWQIELLEAVPASGLQSSKVEVGAWLDAPQELSFSKVEVGAWLDFAGARRRQLIN